jgi:hypothetical protein
MDILTRKIIPSNLRNLIFEYMYDYYHEQHQKKFKRCLTEIKSLWYGLDHFDYIHMAFNSDDYVDELLRIRNASESHEYMLSCNDRVCVCPCFKPFNYSQNILDFAKIITNKLNVYLKKKIQCDCACCQYHFEEFSGPNGSFTEYANCLRIRRLRRIMLRIDKTIKISDDIHLELTPSYFLKHTLKNIRRYKKLLKLITKI